MTLIAQYLINIINTIDTKVCYIFEFETKFDLDFVLTYCCLMFLNIVEFILIMFELVWWCCVYIFVSFEQIIHETISYFHPILKNPEYYEVALASANIVIVVLILIVLIEKLLEFCDKLKKLNDDI